MIIPRAIVAPVVGGVIGYITNDLAIRMLFRPRKALYIGRFHIPFTPGLIPSQQGRIARSIGGVVSGQLLNEETLRQTLLSEGTLDTLRKKVTVFLRTLSKDERTVYDLFRVPGIREKVDVNADALTRHFGRKQLVEWIDEGFVLALGSDIHGTEPGYAPFEKARAFLGERAHVLDQAAARLLSEAKLPG